jgi:hypothetical protein
VKMLKAWMLTLMLATAVGVGVLGAEDPPSTHKPVTGQQLVRWTKELSNWGRWGKDDERGTLNLITPAKRQQAAALVKSGVSLSLGMEFDPALETTPQRLVEYEPSLRDQHKRPFVFTILAREFDEITVDDHSFTHVDALSHRHVCWDANGKEYTGVKGGGPCNPTSYNGYEVSEAEVMKNGRSRRYSLDLFRDGIVTRGILMDIPRLKGVPYLKPGTRIYIEDLEAWEKQAGVKVSAGDAMLLRTGIAAAPKGSAPASLDESVLPWLRQRDITVNAADTFAPLPHFTGNVLGTINVFQLRLEALSTALAAAHRWEFMFVLSPMPIPAGTASAVNPLAVF